MHRYDSSSAPRQLPDDPMLSQILFAEHALGVWRQLAGGIPGQPDPDTPEPGDPMPSEPGEPTIPDEPPPAPIAG